jgi:hypothetical protein
VNKIQDEETERETDANKYDKKSPLKGKYRKKTDPIAGNLDLKGRKTEENR